MPKTIKGWLFFGASVIAVLWAVNNVSFLNGLVARRSA